MIKVQWVVNEPVFDGIQGFGKGFAAMLEGFGDMLVIPIASLTQKNGRSPWLAPFCCFVRDISYRKLSAHGAAGVPVAWLG